MSHKDYNINMINIIVAISIFLNCIALFQPVFISERGYSFNALHQGDPAITWTYLLYGITTFPLEVITLGLGGNGINYLWITYIIYMYVLYLMKRKRHLIMQIILMMLSIAIIIIFYFCHSMISASEDALIEIIGMKMIGYYMILISNALLLVSILGNLLKYMKSKRITTTNKHNE